METELIQEFGTQWPVGLNVGSTGGIRPKYNQTAQEYADLGWCTVQLLYDLYDRANLRGALAFRPPESTQLQLLIELYAKNQILDDNPMSISEMSAMRKRFAHSYALKETLRNNPAAKERQRQGRKKLSERRAAGLSTSAEKTADEMRSVAISQVWAGRTHEERVKILAPATLAAATANSSKSKII